VLPLIRIFLQNSCQYFTKAVPGRDISVRPVATCVLDIGILFCSPHAKIKDKEMVKEELESSTIQFFTETIKNAVADDKKRTPKRNCKKDLHKPVLCISQKKENDQKEDDSDVHSKVDDTQNNEENHSIAYESDGGNKGGDDLSDDII